MVNRIFIVLLSLTFFSSASAELPSLSFTPGASMMTAAEQKSEKAAAEKVAEKAAAEKVAEKAAAEKAAAESGLFQDLKMDMLMTGRNVIRKTLEKVGGVPTSSTMFSRAVQDLILDACLTEKRPTHPSLESLLTRALLENELFNRQCNCLRGISCK